MGLQVRFYSSSVLDRCTKIEHHCLQYVQRVRPLLLQAHARAVRRRRPRLLPHLHGEDVGSADSRALRLVHVRLDLPTGVVESASSAAIGRHGSGPGEPPLDRGSGGTVPASVRLRRLERGLSSVTARLISGRIRSKNCSSLEDTFWDGKRSEDFPKNGRVLVYSGVTYRSRGEVQFLIWSSLKERKKIETTNSVVHIKRYISDREIGQIHIKDALSSNRTTPSASAILSSLSRYSRSKTILTLP